MKTEGFPMNHPTRALTRTLTRDPSRLPVRLLLAEWTRLRRHPVHRWVLIGCLLLLCASALWSGASARALRADAEGATRIQAQLRDQLRSAAPTRAPTNGREGQKAAEFAYEIGRGPLGLAALDPMGGLVLNTPRFQSVPQAVRVGVDMRYTDSRGSGRLANPLLAGAGLPGFATMSALLLSLCALALCCAQVQEQRERGSWRLVCAQSTRGSWRALACSMLLRAVAVIGCGVLASSLAFTRDPGASLFAWLAWCVALSLYCVFWVLVASCLSLLPVSAATATLTGVGMWLLLSFVTPALLDRGARANDEMPSRLQSIIDIRAIQQATEEDNDALVANWYAQHPEQKPDATRMPAEMAWPNTFQPRLLEQDRVIRPAMRRFDEVRRAQERWIDRWSWTGPGTALVLLSERLAGIDADRYARFIAYVDRFEDAWRTAIVPKVMSYSGFRPADIDALPRFDGGRVASSDARRRDVEALARFALAMLLGMLPMAAWLWTRRREFGRP